MTEDRRDTRRRRIRSYVRRDGRLTPAQRRALEELWPRYGVGYRREELDLDTLFGRSAARVLEIGFGNGETLAQMASMLPDTDFLGIEVHRPGVGRLLNRIEEDDLANVRVSRHDAVEVLRDQLPPGSLDAINIFFPDPWPKKRHHKRRLIQPAFVELLASRMKPGALLHIATDWRPYAEHIEDCLDASACFQRVDARLASRPRTKFERRGRRLGHDVRDLVYRRL